MKFLYNKGSFMILIVMLMLIPGQSIAQEQIGGNWKGAINVMGQELIIKTQFEVADAGYNGTIDIPQQGASGIALDSIRVTGQDSVFFEFFTGSGTAAFRGVVEADSITGIFSQNDQYFPFYLARDSGITQKETGDPNELLIEHGSITIAGSLTAPEAKTAETLVILISGSGAQVRDENVMGFGVFKHLADSLVRHGIAAYRFDDRGTGKSTGNFANATLDTLVNDVDTIINHFHSNTKYGFDRIVLLGHSQGGMVATKAAVRNTAVDGVILMASPGLPLREVLRYQVRNQFTSSRLPKQLVEKEITARENLFDAIINNNETAITRAKDIYRRQFAKLQHTAGIDSAQIQQVSRQQAEALASVFNNPQIQSLYDYDPTKDLRELDIPVLALFGGRDNQVPPSKNRKPVEDALQKASSDTEIKIFSKANHLFQQAETGEVREYASLDKQFVEGFTDAVAEWIINQIKN